MRKIACETIKQIIENLKNCGNNEIYQKLKNTIICEFLLEGIEFKEKSEFYFNLIISLLVFFRLFITKSWIKIMNLMKNLLKIQKNLLIF